VLDNIAIAAGLDKDKIIQSYPSLTADDIRATLSYAARLAGERVIMLTQAAPKRNRSGRRAR